MTANKKLLVMAGGTGGHVFPAIAVAKKLQDQGWEVLWLGTPDRMESRLVPQHGFNIHFIHIQGVRGNGLLRLLKAPFKILSATWQSIKAIQEFKPDVALGMGGFVSGPAGLAAWIMRIPLILHEQNAVPGLTNRLLSRIAQKILTAFPATFDQKNVQVVGNPVREELVKLHQQNTRPLNTPLKILIIGGSLGAKVLNETLPKAIAYAKKHQHSFEVMHQVGKNNQETVLQKYHEALNETSCIQVHEFIEDMAQAYLWADLVICRSGALTVSELAMMGLPSILVPLPHAVDDHQTKNASMLADAQAGILMPQTLLSAKHLGKMLVQLSMHPEELKHMRAAALQVAKVDATEQVAQACTLLT